MKTIILIMTLCIAWIWYIDWDTLNRECQLTYGNVCATEQATAEMQKSIQQQRQKEIEISNKLYWQDIFYR